MKFLALILLVAIISTLTALFCWVKGQPVDWDGFWRRGNGGMGGYTAHHPGPPLKRYP